MNELLAKRLGDVQHLGDHVCRKGVSELRKNIHPVVLAKRDEQAVNDLLDLRPERFNCGRRESFVHEFAKARMLRGIEEKHPEAERAGEFDKFLLLLGRKLVNQGASALGRESGVAKERRAICVFENGPNAAVNIEVLDSTPIKVSTIGRVRVSQEIRREEFLCRKGC